MISAVAAPPLRPSEITQSVATRGFGDALVFIIPAFLFVTVQRTGRLYISELLLMATFPFALVSQRGALRNRWPGAIVALGLIWLWAQIVTDLYRPTAFNDLARGWLKVAFTVSDFIAIFYLISGRRRRILLFTAGLAVGYGSQYRFNPIPYGSWDPWKFGFAIPVTLLVVLLSCHRVSFRIRFLSSIVVAGAGLLNFVLGFRSLGGVCLLSAIYLTTQEFVGRPGSFKVSPGKLIAFCSAGAVLIILLITAYNHAARDNLLGPRAAEKYRKESGGNFGVLLGGRPELFVSTRAIIDSPLIGHGSFAKDPKYTNALLSMLVKHGYTPSGDLKYTLRHSDYVIPSHSYLFGSWVDAGIFGGIFWIAVLALTSNTLVITFGTRTGLSPLIAFLGVLLLWSVFFSPYGGDQRILAMFSVAVLISCRTFPPFAQSLKQPRTMPG